MRIAEILRRESLKGEGTVWILSIDKSIFSFCMEPADNENHSNISSIPAGQYICKRYSSAKYPETFQVMDVTDRSYILFHAGNTVEDTAGCICLGDTVGKLKGDRAILNSGKTFSRFLDEMAGETEFHLTIKEEY